MNRTELKTILQAIYKTDCVKSIMCGRVKPSYKKMLLLAKQGIPFEAWADIKSYLQENTTTPKNGGQELPSVTKCDEVNTEKKGMRNIDKDGLETIVIPKGTLIHLNGIPFRLKCDTEVLGLMSNYKLALSQSPISCESPNQATASDDMSMTSNLSLSSVASNR